MMNKPKMILFDSGGTLCYDVDYDLRRATSAIMPYLENPSGRTADELYASLLGAFDEIRPAREAGFEISQYTIMRLACGKCGIELNMDMDSFEEVFRKALTPVEMTPHIDELLAFLNGSGVRTGVISNSKYSGRSLSERLNALLPENRFEFFISSCDYTVCKPGKTLFEIALKKAGLNACEVCYCGDSVYNDVKGAHAVGMLPVLYDREGKRTVDGGIECITVRDWRELIGVLKEWE